MKIFKILTLTSLIALTTACSQIDSNNVMVESTFGQYKNEVSPPGVYFTLFKTTYEITGREVSFELSNMTPKSSDNVTMADVDLTIYFKINTAKAAQFILKYSNDIVWDQSLDAYVLGQNLVIRTAREAVYNGFAKYASSDLHTKRNDLSVLIRQSIQDELNSNMGDFFQVTNVIIRNVVTDPRLDQAINDAAQVEFRVRQKKLELELAHAEAERIKIEAKGQAEANKIISDSLTDKLVELRRIESMSNFAKQGTHTVVIPNNTTPLIQVK